MCKESSSTVDHFNDNQFEEPSDEVGNTFDNVPNEGTMQKDDQTSDEEDRGRSSAAEAASENEEVSNTFNNVPSTPNVSRTT